MFRILMILILILTSHCIESKKKTRRIYFVSAKVNKNAKFLNNFDISISKDNTSINILMDVSKDLDKLWSTASISVWLEALSDYKQILAYNLNVCQCLRRSKWNKAIIIDAWISNVLKYGNITKSCPVVKNLYYFANLKPEKESVPSFTPAGRCYVTSNIYTIQNDTKEVIGSCELEIDLK